MFLFLLKEYKSCIRSGYKDAKDSARKEEKPQLLLREIDSNDLKQETIEQLTITNIETKIHISM